MKTIKSTHMQSYAKETGSNRCMFWWNNFDYYMKPSNQHTCYHMVKQLALIDACSGDKTSILIQSRQIDTHAI